MEKSFLFSFFPCCLFSLSAFILYFCTFASVLNKFSTIVVENCVKTVFENVFAKK